MEKFNLNGEGLNVSDIVARFRIDKNRARLRVKWCLSKGILFTLGRNKPQRYFPTTLKAKIVQRLAERNVTNGPTGGNRGAGPLVEAIQHQKAQNLI